MKTLASPDDQVVRLGSKAPRKNLAPQLQNMHHIRQMRLLAAAALLIHPTATLQTVGIVGAGLMGGGIGMSFGLSAGA